MDLRSAAGMTLGRRALSRTQRKRRSGIYPFAGAGTYRVKASARWWESRSRHRAGTAPAVLRATHHCSALVEHFQLQPLFFHGVFFG
ncbi:hypothetical protein SADFL11_00047410 [Roseibium alexandrii DFL-11]|uniref:Uncharacterized protein n=1 Tax=Roseibium alexandrii (strain DSM 17067 / NCIMB 14079 / DFL-11) TaxID=244592 RepID=A0A5E8UXN4_ROSAD|nr:hypothetical protein SADFL11_00047410 [Roseibium alexandrii DFL-11]